MATYCHLVEHTHMAMQLLLKQNLELRQLQILELGFESDYLENFLIRTETCLKKLKYQKGLHLIKNVYKNDGVQYRGVIDWLLCVVSPEWRVHTIDYYTYDTFKLGESITYDEINEMDLLLEGTVIELTGMYEELVKSRMLRREYLHDGGMEPDQFMQALALENIRTTVAPALPKAPMNPKRKALAS